ncbi:MAG: YbhB/YbcL family Raf kinase inhibitor-like protein [Anaerolineales bacterium]|nr:YbhB/YbcL family Raf kinase inhibitor-like protein [Anaerolineales bacterium]
MAIILTSSAFSEGAVIPRRHACNGDNLSPALSWNKSVMAVRSYALIMEDPDAPSGTFVHWVLFNIPPDRNQLPEGVEKNPDVPGIGRQGVNDAQKHGYCGPCPPPGKPHRYFFKIFAIDRILDLPAESTAARLREAIQSHLLDSGSLLGTYSR